MSITITTDKDLVITETASNSLRFILRDGRRILQQWYTVVRRTAGGEFVSGGADWRDVLCVDEKGKPVT